jgi:hypothetical protein
VHAIFTGPGGADRIVRALARRSKCRTDAAGETRRSGKLLDPGGTVAEVMTAARIGSTRNEERIQLVVGRCVRPAAKRERIARVGQAGAECHDPTETGARGCVDGRRRGTQHGHGAGEHGVTDLHDVLLIARRLTALGMYFSKYEKTLRQVWQCRPLTTAGQRDRCGRDHCRTDARYGRWVVDSRRGMQRENAVAQSLSPSRQCVRHEPTWLPGCRSRTLGSVWPAVARAETSRDGCCMPNYGRTSCCHRGQS